MKIELSSEELLCLLFWYAVFKSEIAVNSKDHDVDRKLFEKLKTFLDFDKVAPLKDFVTGTPKYQPGELDVKT